MGIMNKFRDNYLAEEIGEMARENTTLLVEMIFELLHRIEQLESKMANNAALVAEKEVMVASKKGEYLW